MFPSLSSSMLEMSEREIPAMVVGLRLCVILQESVGNCTQPDVALRFDIVLGLGYNTSLDALLPVIRFTLNSWTSKLFPFISG